MIKQSMPTKKADCEDTVIAIYSALKNMRTKSKLCVAGAILGGAIVINSVYNSINSTYKADYIAIMHERNSIEDRLAKCQYSLACASKYNQPELSFKEDGYTYKLDMSLEQYKKMVSALNLERSKLQLDSANIYNSKIYREYIDHYTTADTKDIYGCILGISILVSSIFIEGSTIERTPRRRKREYSHNLKF